MVWIGGFVVPLFYGFGMTAVVVNSVAAKVAVALAAVDELANSSLAGCSDEELLDVVRRVERLRRTVEALDNVTIPELEARGLPARFMVRGTKQLLGGLLNLSPFEAGARVKAAQVLGPRTQVSGEALPPLLPLVASARAAGLMTGRQAEVISRCTGKLREARHLRSDDVAEAEAFLVEQAVSFDAHTLSGIAQRLLDTLDPDGTPEDDARQQRRRFLSLLPRDDGMWRLTADLNAETAAMAMTVLHSLAAPKTSDGFDGGTSRTEDSSDRQCTAGDANSTDPGGGGDQPANTTANGTDRDGRTGGQRLHDALTSVLKLALRSGALPRFGGVPATVLITMTAEQFESRTGLATTSYGQKLSVDQALRMADEAAIAWVVHNGQGGILNYGTTRRLAGPEQTLALIARDRGCAFPGCADPPEWTERHHITPWRRHGPTNLDNLCLLCDFHHDRIDTGGWTIKMKRGVPWFIPPTWIDPQQRPRRNERP